MPIPPWLTQIGSALSVKGLKNKVTGWFSSKRNSGGASGASGGSAMGLGGANGLGPTALFKNWVEDGKLFGQNPLVWVFRVTTGLLFMAMIGGLLFVVARTEGGQGIISGVMGGLKGTGDALEKGADVYFDQLYILSGEQYASEIDANSESNLGINVVNSETSQSNYDYADPVTIWTEIYAKPYSDGTPLNLVVDCWHESGGAKTPGRISPATEFSIDEERTLDIRCDFEAGILSQELADLSVDDYSVSATNTFFVVADFDFVTKAYVRKYIMDGETYRASEDNLLSNFPEMQSQPVTKNTDGPIQIGIGTKENPVLVYDEISNVERSYLRISIDNSWEGVPTDIKGFKILLPTGISLAECDSSIFFEPDSTELEGYSAFRLAEESVDYLSRKVVHNEIYVAQNIRCFIDYESDLLFEGREKSLPIISDIIAEMEYDYRIEYEHIVSASPSYDDVFTSAKPSIIGTQTTFTCSAEQISGGDFLDSKFTLLHRKSGADEAVIVPGYNGVGATCVGGECIKRIDIVNLGSDVEIGDFLTCKFEITVDGETNLVTSTKLVRIINVPPEVEYIYYSDSDHPENSNLVCNAEIYDEEGSQNLIPIFKFIINDQIYLKEGGKDEDVSCEETSANKYLCSATLEETIFSEGEYVGCTVIISDGEISSHDEQIKTIAITESIDLGNGTTLPCTETDSGYDIDSLGKVVGQNENGVQVDADDYCQDANTLIEYYCLNNVVSIAEITCACSGGVC